MDFAEYKLRGKEMVDYIAEYLQNIRDRKVFPDVKPGYMKALQPETAPAEGEEWENIFKDVERIIMPGVTHWQSPHMHAYFPALNSFPSLLGDMLADAINCLGFTWASSPACTELEMIVTNWLGKMCNIPREFLHVNERSKGGGVLQTTASEATLVCLLAGRTRAIQTYKANHAESNGIEVTTRLVAYCSDQAHSSVDKAALIGLVQLHHIESNEDFAMTGRALRSAILEDIKNGLVPFWVCATLGTTSSCAFDELIEIGKICKEFDIWLHVDSAYAGSAFICPEFQVWLNGVERADSISFNPSKWMMVHFDATALWVKDSSAIVDTFQVQPLYLQHENTGTSVDFMHWQIPLSRRFRALKIWFVLRSYGIKGLQNHIRHGVGLASIFEQLVLGDTRFEVPAKRHLGMVVFRLKGSNAKTELLLKYLNQRGNMHCIPSALKGKYVIRFTVTSARTTEADIRKDWAEILEVMEIISREPRTEKCLASSKETLLATQATDKSYKLQKSPINALFESEEFFMKPLTVVNN